MYRRDDLPILAPLLARAIPVALKRLRDKAGFRSLRPAAEAIEKATGQSVSRAAISKWESGTMPQLDSALYFLLGLGFTFRDLQDALEEVLRDLEAEDNDPAAGFLAKLRASPQFRQNLRAIIETTSAASPEPTTAELLGLLAQLDTEQEAEQKEDAEDQEGDGEDEDDAPSPEGEEKGKGNGTNGPDKAD
ncbi:MAG TPA: hypothetical protein VGG06_29120 [Thermoanaerobaculia bacterium]